MRVEKYRLICDELLKKHYGVRLDDTGIVDEEVEHLIQSRVRPYQAINLYAENKDLERLDIHAVFGMPSHQPLIEADEIQTISIISSNANAIN